MSEMVLEVIKAMKTEINKGLATNLYAGIASATNNFGAHSVIADTFEAAALLLKSGAVKRPTIAAKPLSPQIGGQFGGQQFQQMNNQQMGGFQPQFGQQFGGYPQYPQAPMPQPMVPQAPQQIQNFQNIPTPQPMQPVSLEVTPAQYDEAEQAEELPTTEVQSAAGPEMDPQFIENKEVKPDEMSEEIKPKKAPKDWLKPKIFKGTRLS